MTIEVDLQQAIDHHQAGRYKDAELGYQAILSIDPAHPDANHNFGLVALKNGQPAQALPFLKAAVISSPQRRDFWLNYISALLLGGQGEEAFKACEAGYRQGHVLSPAGERGAPDRSELDALVKEYVETIDTLTARGLLDSAEALAQQMVQIVPTHGFGWKVLAQAHLRRGDLDAARLPLENAVTLLPFDTELASHLLAARSLHEALEADSRGDFAKAGALYQTVLEIYPEHPDANHRLGVIAIRLHQPEASLPYLERALGVNPNQLQYWANYLDGLIQSDRLQAAWVVLGMAQQRGFSGQAADRLVALMTHMSKEKVYKVAQPVRTASASASAAQPSQQATAQQPSPADLPAPVAPAKDVQTPSDREMMLLAGLFNDGKIDQAIQQASAFAKKYPHHYFGWKVWAASLHRAGQYDEALDHATTSLRIDPDDADVIQVACGILTSKGRHQEGETLARRLLELKPDYAEAHRLMGIIHMHRGRLDEGEKLCRKAVELGGPTSMNLNPLGVTLMKQGRLLEAADVFREAIKANPDDDIAFSNVAFCLTHSESVTPAELYAEHRRFSARFEQPAKAHWPRHKNSRDPNRTLRVGFISGDFCRHAVANFFEPVLRHLSRDASISLYAYSNTPIHDNTTDRLRALIPNWRHVVGMKHEPVAEMIRADGIDILVDLSGHTAENRLRTMAFKPAPVQASWIGYPGTTGLDAVDYFLADRFWVPEQFATQFSEKIAYLPAVAPFEADEACPPLSMLPALHNGYLTFGSFNRLDKLRRDVVALWSRVLRELPDSRMLIGAMPVDGGTGELTKWFAEEGIARERLEFRPRSSVAVYLQQHHHVDVCLDSFPFSGLTTVLHSLWMGVPTITLPSQTVPGRSGFTAMSHVGLEQFVAGDTDDYVRRAVAVSADLPALAALRSGMRERCLQSPMFRPEAIADGLNRALRVMWRRWCEGLPAETFDITR